MVLTVSTQLLNFALSTALAGGITHGFYLLPNVVMLFAGYVLQLLPSLDDTSVT